MIFFVVHGWKRIYLPHGTFTFNAKHFTYLYETQNIILFSVEEQVFSSDVVNKTL